PAATSAIVRSRVSGSGLRRGAGPQPRPRALTGGSMKRILIALFVAATIFAVLVVGGYAAGQADQFHGPRKGTRGRIAPVGKSAKERWQVEVPKDVKGGAPKVGDKVTVYYKMVATEIEAKAATTAAAPKKK